jgi:hypothetical protein
MGFIWSWLLSCLWTTSSTSGVAAPRLNGLIRNHPVEAHCFPDLDGYLPLSFLDCFHWHATSEAMCRTFRGLTGCIWTPPQAKKLIDSLACGKRLQSYIWHLEWALWWLVLTWNLHQGRATQREWHTSCVKSYLCVSRVNAVLMWSILDRLKQTELEHHKNRC